MLHRLMRRAVLAEADGVVRPDVDDVDPRHRREAHGPAHVVAEVQERAGVRDESAVIGDAVDDAAHRMLADPESQVASGLVGAEIAAVPDIGEVGFGQVGRTAEQLRHRSRKASDRVAARVARARAASRERTRAGRAPSPPAACPPGGVGARRPRPDAPTRIARGPPPIRRPAALRARRPLPWRRGPRPERRTSDPGPSRRPASSAGPRPRRVAGRAPSGCPGGSGSHTRCGSGRR